MAAKQKLGPEIANVQAWEVPFGKRRSPESKEDFRETDLGLHLKRTGKSSLLRYDYLADFGIFLGRYTSPEVEGNPADGKWVVGIKGPEGGFSATELFDSFEDLRREWELD